MAHRGLIRAATWLATGVLLLAVAVPVSAAKPVRGCSADKVPMTRDAFRDMSIALGAPPEIMFSAAWEAGWAALDKNGDTIGCVQDAPDNAGHLDGLVFNVVDNTSNH